MSTPQNTGPRDRGALLACAAIALAAVLTLTGLAAGFGISTSCTNARGCTAERCPAVCDRIDIAVWANSAGQLVLLGLAAVVLVRRPARTSALALILLALSTGLAAGSLALAQSWQ
ncbi:MAG: hypothetical protein ACR2LH_02305 [Thermoleophilaceae bacterium]